MKLLESFKRIKEGKASFDDEALILKEFESRYVPHKIENYLFDQEELKAEYMFACWNAIFRAKMTVGDPIAFCVRRGKGAMLDYYRRVSSNKLMKVCSECNTKVAYDRRNQFCKLCGSDYISMEKEECVHEHVEFYDHGTHFTDAVLTDIIFDELIRLLYELKDLQRKEKILAIKAIKDRTDFYDYAIENGVNHNTAEEFHRKIIKVIHKSHIFN